MKEPAPSEARKGLTKEKKQLVLLGVLSAALLAVLAVPFGAAEPEPEPEPPPAAEAEPDPAGQPQPETAAADPAPAPAPAPAATPRDPVRASAEPAEEEGLVRSPFESIWALTKPVETKIDDLPAPVVTLNGTLTSGRTPAAVIDGQTRFIGDMIQGWVLESIGSREVTLRSPGKNRVTIRMPILQLKDKRPPEQAASPAQGQP